MLVFSRRRGQSYVIIAPNGDVIDIETVDIYAEKTRQGITAPMEYQVHRREVWEAIQRENRAAAQVKGVDVATVGGVPAGRV